MLFYTALVFVIAAIAGGIGFSIGYVHGQWGPGAIKRVNALREIAFRNGVLYGRRTDTIETLINPPTAKKPLPTLVAAE